ncbi:hypothetical protein R7E51_17785 [Vibrio sp. Vb1166]|jgi:uncharacterized protein YegP (UPF0339 family)|uniref:hypothetical protein n=1 Tax=Vibrio TaxID=662 RepID=UPI001929EF2E|nr:MULTISPECIES: hypothetical protein [Vibrio]MCF9040356.1 hypothetical protein [Vibrio parahaemolyticus]MBO0138690.1 hypothetical protein [Vibrio sp. Vb2736]MBO0205247.1 hypothetical protein [Vibrio alginolyticus]MDW1862433.1 hypothetical protein [Vibrio sp. Vb1166]WQE79182.1 hypothetical protein SO574_22525 [Vibrio alfacsensis]
MSNTDKRSKRAKNKAKKARLQKQKNIEKKNKVEMVSVGSDFLTLFQSLPKKDNPYELIPLFKEYLVENGSIDIEAETAMLFVTHAFWLASGDKSFVLDDVKMIVSETLNNPEFLEYYDDEREKGTTKDTNVIYPDFSNDDDEFEVKYSPLSCEFEHDEELFEIAIYEGDNGLWLLEVVGSCGTSCLWSEQYKSDQDAFNEAIETIKSESTSMFLEDKLH